LIELDLENALRMKRQGLTSSRTVQGKEGEEEDHIRVFKAKRIPDLMEVTRARLIKDKEKVKNLIGNNPYIVKNYVQGAALNNSLNPQHLLKPTKINYEDDDEFLEYYLKELREAERKLKKNQAKSPKAGKTPMSKYSKSQMPSHDAHGSGSKTKTY
jgi:hypothetical protein